MRKHPETVTLTQGDEIVVVNKGDQEKEFLATGWLPEGDEGQVEGTKHVGGGYYELPDGTRVKGKENALAALDKLKADTEN